jgi:hypothetical protein
MIIRTSPIDSYDAPEGFYRAICHDVFEWDDATRKGTNKMLRIVWRLLNTPNDKIRYLVGKTYKRSLAGKGVLRRDLHTWLGHDVNPHDFDLQTIRGTEGRVDVRHKRYPGHGKPFCLVRVKDEPVTDASHADD